MSGRFYKKVTYWGLMPDGRRVSTYRKDGRVLTHLACVEFTDGVASYWQHNFYDSKAAAERGVRSMIGHRRTYMEKHGYGAHIKGLRTALLPAYFLATDGK